MNYLNFAVKFFEKGIFDFETCRDKRILFIGGYTLLIENSKAKNSKNFLAYYLCEKILNFTGAADCKCVATYERDFYVTDYRGNMEDLPEILSSEEKFDIIFVLDGMEKVLNPAKALNAVRNVCVDGGQIFLFLRTPVDLTAKNRLDYYEDNWRYEPADIPNFFYVDKNFSVEAMENVEAFFISFQKSDKKFFPNEDFKFFNCRTQKKISYSESLRSNYFRSYRELMVCAKGEPTDKTLHNYLDKYEFFLNKWKDKKFNLLELGIFNGGSLRMWKKYFRNAEIYGVDINPECKIHADERIHVEIMDLSLLENLEALKNIQPEIIIDDASHIWSHQIKALINLFPVLPSGGIFIMEDLETSVNRNLFSDGFDDFDISMYDVCERISKIVVSKIEDEVEDFLSEDITKIGLLTDMISIIKGSCIFVKR